MIYDERGYDPSGGARGCLTIIILAIIIAGLTLAIGVLSLAGYA